MGTLVTMVLVATVLVVSPGVTGATPAAFVPDPGPNGPVNDVVVLDDGSVVIGGDFTEVDGLSVNYLARLKPDGQIDKTFAPEPDGVVHDLDLLADGRVLVAGEFTSLGGVARDRVAITGDDGVVDTGFAVTAGPDGPVFDAEITSTGTVVIGGAFAAVDGAPRPRVARLTASGALDATFVPGTGADNTVFAVAVDLSDRVLIGGSFTSVGTRPWARIARLTPTGSPDTAGWAGVSTDGVVFDLESHGTGVLAVGAFAQVGTFARGGIVRLDASGQVDTTYASGSGFNAAVRAVSVDAAGAAVAVGGFVNFGSRESIRVARLTAAGTLDLTFDIGNGPDGLVTSVTHTGLASAPGSVVIGGVFTEVDTDILGRVALLDGDGRPAVATPIRPAVPGPVSAIPGNGQASVAWSAPTDTGTAPLQGYRVEISSDGGATWQRPSGSCALASTLSSTSTSCTATGLANGTELVVAVAAVSVNGSGAATLSPAVTPQPAPGAPGAPVVAAVGEGEILVSFDPASPVDSHTATASPGGATCTATAPASSCSITVGDPDLSYTVTSVAQNPSGVSPASPGSRPVLPVVCAKPPSPFVDVTDANYFAIGATCLLRLGITTENPFRPADGVTRAQMAAFLWRMSGSPASATSCGFTDEATIPTWARAGACWMKSEGITVAPAYDPARVVPRGQMAAFLWRWAGEPDAPSSCGFTDEGDIPGFARQGACWLFDQGVTDRNPFAPTLSVNRAQMAAFLHRLGLAVGQWL